MTTADNQALTYLLSPSRSGIDPALFVPLLRLLAEGEPVRSPTWPPPADVAKTR